MQNKKPPQNNIEAASFSYEIVYYSITILFTIFLSPSVIDTK
jgi:hypothetical protein